MMQRLAQLFVILIIAIAIVSMISWMALRPSWQVSARNSPKGVVIEIYKSNAAQPTYTTVLDEQTITTEVERVARADLPEGLGKTTFYDETLRPGRWIFVVNDKTEIDISERALTVDGGAEIVPKE